MKLFLSFVYFFSMTNKLGNAVEVNSPRKINSKGEPATRFCLPAYVIMPIF